MNDFFYKKLDAYKIAKEFTTYVYQLLHGFPPFETYALCDQIRRAAISIPSNIVEGMGRMGLRERVHFLGISYASLAEMLCQLDIAQSIGYISEEELSQAEEIAGRLSRVMPGLRRALIEKYPNKNNYE